MKFKIWHIVILRQIQFLLPELFYDNSFYLAVKTGFYYLFIIVVLMYLINPEKANKNEKILIFACILLEVFRAFSSCIIIFDNDKFILVCSIILLFYSCLPNYQHRMR